MTYAVVVSADDGPELAGQLELAPDSMRFSDGTRMRYAELGDIYLERRAGGHSSPRPALVLVSHAGSRRRIVSLEGLGALHELAEELYEARGKTAD